MLVVASVIRLGRRSGSAAARVGLPVLLVRGVEHLREVAEFGEPVGEVPERAQRPGEARVVLAGATRGGGLVMALLAFRGSGQPARDGAARPRPESAERAR